MCHRYVSKQRRDRKYTICAWLAACTFASACVSDGDIILAPLGEHEAFVGEPIEIPLVAISEHDAPLRWELMEGPSQMRLLQRDSGDVLAWTATVFDLAPVPPGVARAAGVWHKIVAKACDQSGQCATATGRVRAVPTPTARAQP